MYVEVACVLVSSGTPVQPQIILDPDYLPEYLSISYDYTTTDFYIFKKSTISYNNKSLKKSLYTQQKKLKVAIK